jgi:hypothetical protein
MANIEKAKTLKLPLPPWSLQDGRNGEKGLITRLGEVEAERVYCELARELGYFNPKAEPKNYRPSLDPTPFLEVIREQHKQAGKPKE